MHYQLHNSVPSMLLCGRKILGQFSHTFSAKSSGSSSWTSFILSGLATTVVPAEVERSAKWLPWKYCVPNFWEISTYDAISRTTSAFRASWTALRIYASFIYYNKIIRKNNVMSIPGISIKLFVTLSTLRMHYSVASAMLLSDFSTQYKYKVCSCCCDLQPTHGISVGNVCHESCNNAVYETPYIHNNLVNNTVVSQYPFFFNLIWRGSYSSSVSENNRITLQINAGFNHVTSCSWYAWNDCCVSFACKRSLNVYEKWQRKH